MKLSICISTWSRMNDLHKAILSIEAQDFNKLNYELVIVDNSSNDGTKEYLSKVSSVFLDINFKYMIMPHSNFTAMQTLNMAFSMASGDYILVMDDDAYLYDENVISKLVEIMDDNYNCAIICANVQYENPRSDGLLTQMLIRDCYGNFLNTDEINKLPDYIKYYEFHGACALFRRGVVESLGFYEESFNIYVNEFDLACKVLSLGYDVLFAPHIIAKHMEYANSKCNKKAIYYLKNTNTVLTRLFNTKFGRFKIVTMRTWMTYIMHMRNMIKTCDKVTLVKYTMQVVFEYIRAIYKSFNPDMNYNINTKDSCFYNYIVTSLSNNYKKNIKQYFKSNFRKILSLE